jgi:Bifunctional DNA primase/polymerase, N-terminal
MYADQIAIDPVEAPVSVLSVSIPEIQPSQPVQGTSSPAAQQVTDSIRVCVEDALARGFKVIACLPHDVCDDKGKFGKAPFVKYSPHACNSGTNDPKIALRPWIDGTAANYGVACGLSGITVVDVDHGIHSVEEFEAWKKFHNLPDTYTVRSGRDGEEIGFHIYYTGVVSTTGFNFGGVSGELKSAGGYVVGAGSIHESGKRYTVYSDVDLQPLPEGLRLLAKNKAPVDFKPTADGGTLIPAGQRWIHMQSAAGKLRNAGLDYEGIYAGLKNFLKTNCEDGENYPEESVQAMAKAAIKKFDPTPLQPTLVWPPKAEPKAEPPIQPVPVSDPTPDPTPAPIKIVPSGHYSMSTEDWATYDFSKEESDP